MKSTFFKIIKQKKKKLMVRSSIGIPKQCLSLLTVKSPKDIILLTHMYFFCSSLPSFDKETKEKVDDDIKSARKWIKEYL